MRRLAAKFNSLSRPDGSVVLSRGETVVQAGVYGPIEVRQNREVPEKATVEVFFRNKSGRQSCADRLQEKVIRSAMETVMLVALHPRSSISVTLQELHNDGGMLASCINAAYLCAMDAAIATRCQVAAVHAAVMPDGTVQLDPTLDQEKEAAACCTIAFENQELEVISVHTEGQISVDTLSKCMQVCSAAVEEVFQFYREAMATRYNRYLPPESDE
uniref:Putative exosomal 3'-5' exoribonuclease complex subunit rrp41 n=2 Tax=Ornithodoros turicata TaxID=34597 RepID=A0A2R5LHI8_9ACAR